MEDIEKNQTKKLVNYVRENNDFKNKTVVVDKFISEFSTEFNREPTFDEINDNLQDKLSNNVINAIMQKKDNSNNV